MLTEEMRAAGWIEHDGGPCPVPLDSMPDIMFRDGERETTGQTADTWTWEWTILEQARLKHIQITAYRPEQPHDQ
jgi:hypothetical protein